jgi:glycine/D-amino acid oxidase-like deaminating enzyme
MADFDVVVIGAGITGLTAAKAAVQSGLRTANIEALMFGGLVVNINELDGETTGLGHRPRLQSDDGDFRSRRRESVRDRSAPSRARVTG